ncbi:unnamed protein product, partial [Prorocentrum cordatum]
PFWLTSLQVPRRRAAPGVSTPGVRGASCCLMAASVLPPAAAGFLADVGQFLYVVRGGSPDGGVVPVDVSIARPDTWAPFVLSAVVAFFYLQAIEAVGRAVAAVLRVGSGLDLARLSRKRERFCTAWGEAVYFAIQVFVNYRLFGGASWYWPSSWGLLMAEVGKETLRGESAPPLYHCTREMRTYYLLEFGWYSMCLVVLFFKKRRSDFLEMLAHHAITSVLVFTSYSYGYLRVGVVVMNLHNLFDPLLNVAKCCHYAFKGPLHILADVSFGLGAVVFLVSRLVLYPLAIYHVWLYLFASRVFASPGAQPAWAATADQWACLVLLCMLYPIHLFWFYLILKVAKKGHRWWDCPERRAF